MLIGGVGRCTATRPRTRGPVRSTCMVGPKRPPGSLASHAVVSDEHFLVTTFPKRTDGNHSAIPINNHRDLIKRWGTSSATQ